jgi:hypothetical protein
MAAICSRRRSPRPGRCCMKASRLIRTYVDQGVTEAMAWEVSCRQCGAAGGFPCQPNRSGGHETPPRSVQAGRQGHERCSMTGGPSISSGSRSSTGGAGKQAQSHIDVSREPIWLWPWNEQTRSNRRWSGRLIVGLVVGIKRLDRLQVRWELERVFVATRQVLGLDGRWHRDGFWGGVKRRECHGHCPFHAILVNGPLDPAVPHHAGNRRFP